MAQVLDWTLQFGRKYQGPLDVDGYFSTLAAANEYLVKYATSRVWEGQTISIGTGDSVALYIVKKNAEGVWFLEESGGSIKNFANSTELLAFAVTKNIGKLAYLTTGDDNYSSGVYVVTGNGDVSKLAQSSATGDVQSDVDNLKGRVGGLETTVDNLGDAVEELQEKIDVHPVMDVKAGETSIIGENGIVNIDTALVKESTSLNPLSHAAIAAKFKSVDELLELIPKFDIKVVESLPTSDISKSTLYLIVNKDGKDRNLYTEYIWLESVGQAGHWEKLGEQELDLSGYYTSGETDSAIATALADYVKKNGTDRLITAAEAAQIITNKTAIETINNTTIPGVTGRLDSAEERLDDIEADLTGVVDNVQSGNEDILVATKGTDDLSRLITLTPVVGSFKTATKNEVDGIAKVSDVRDFVEKSIEAAFAWEDVEE